MPSVFVAGDLFEAEGLGAVAHGCNCAGVMGKGIAVEFKRRHPQMFREYRRRCQAGEFQVGDVFFWAGTSPAVFNLGTQHTWRTKAKLPDVQTAIAEMIQMAENLGIRRIGLPRIGAGLGGLSWPDVRAVLEVLGGGTEVELLVFEEFTPGRPTPASGNPAHPRQ